MADIFELPGKELYKDERIRIHASDRDPEGHDVVILGNYICLPRGVLRELSRDTLEDFASKYSALRGGAPYNIENPGVPIDDFRVALAQARIAELEDEVSYAYGQISDARDRG